VRRHWAAAAISAANASLAESILNPHGNGEKLHSKETRPIKRGDILSFRLSGAGGYGPPEKRDPKAITEDVADGYVTAEHALRECGWTPDVTPNPKS
jgi:N-methylhydantoinase B